MLTVGNHGTIGGVRTATTLGFSVEERDRGRLEHLAERFGGGNRSAFLRRALDVMERLERVERLSRVQSYGAGQLYDAGLTQDDIPGTVAKALSNPTPESVAQAKLIVAAMSKRWTTPVRGDGESDARLLTAFQEAIDET